MSEIPYLLSPEGDNEGWTVVAHSNRDYKSWNKLMESIPESLERCLEYLCEHPMQRQTGRVYPLKGKKNYPNAWEFEVTSGDRVYYVPNPNKRVVTVYYAGKHPNPPSPRPPKDLI